VLEQAEKLKKEIQHAINIKASSVTVSSGTIHEENIALLRKNGFIVDTKFNMISW